MSYLVLARKYRSRTFSELVGQEHVVKALTNALTQGRLHHAYLFTGTRGVGKTSVSRILAKSLNCVGADGQGGITAEPCGVCHACRDIDSGRFVDYIELDAASNRGVDEITALLDQAVYKPVVGRFKVYMIDEVHMLSTTAFNAMLKTLEEPPDYLKFVLATTDPQKVPPTVLSRCLQFNLRPMAPQTVQQHLARVLADEHIEADAGALRLLSRAARGSMRDALSLTDQAIAYGAGQLAETGVREMLGAVDRGHAVRIVEALAALDGAAVVGAADALRGLGLSAAGTLDELAELLQQMAVTQAVPDALDDADPESPTVRRLAALLAADELQLLYSMALHGRAELGLAPDEYSGLVMVLLRMLAFRPGDAVRQAPAAGPAEVAAIATRATPSRGADPEVVAPVASVASVAGSAASQPASATDAASDERKSPNGSPWGRPTPAIDAAPDRPAPAAGAVSDLAPSATGAASDLGASTSSAVSDPDVPDSIDAMPVSSGSVPSSTSSAPRQAALRTSATIAATTRIAADPTISTSDRRAPTANAPASPMARRDANMQASVGSADSVDTAESVDFGEPPPWLDVPFDAEENVAVMPPPVRSRAAVPSPPAERAATTSPVVSRGAGPAGVAPSPPAPITVFTSELGDRWADLVDRLSQAGSIGALVRELALQSECLSAGEGGAWRLRVERESLRAPGLVEKLRLAMAGLLGGEVALDVERGAAIDSPALRNAALRDRRQREAERLIQDDPLVRSLMAQYRTARIVPGSIKPI